MLYSMLIKFIKAKTYNKKDIEKRVNTFYAVDQIEEKEYIELIELIQEVYKEQ